MKCSCLSVFAVPIAVKMLGHDPGPVLIATCPASQPCSRQLSFPYSGLKSFCGTCFKQCHLPESSRGTTKDCPRCADLVKHIHTLHGMGLSGHSCPASFAKESCWWPPAPAAGHNQVVGPELCMSDRASLRSGRKVLALHCWVHTCRVSPAGRFPTCSLFLPLHPRHGGPYMHTPTATRANTEKCMCWGNIWLEIRLKASDVFGHIGMLRTEQTQLAFALVEGMLITGSVGGTGGCKALRTKKSAVAHIKCLYCSEFGQHSLNNNDRLS